MLKPLTKLGFTVFPKDATKFFIDVVNEALDVRKRVTGEVSNDGNYNDFYFLDDLCLSLTVSAQPSNCLNIIYDNFVLVRATELYINYTID